MEGAKPVGSPPEEFNQFLKSEFGRWKKVAEFADIQPE
jgi:tripartite-type tricarboxylate transporter receptor subunit TctC